MNPSKKVLTRNYFTSRKQKIDGKWANKLFKRIFYRIKNKWGEPDLCAGNRPICVSRFFTKKENNQEIHKKYPKKYTTKNTVHFYRLLSAKYIESMPVKI
eukprot:GEMP01139788.1.p1 GENE.GEMP01139788.1~~GEMP01139788.1.p1  ORF type:complete len:111 (-),score=3.37 GEMP01139788.1:135-434(-)